MSLENVEVVRRCLEAVSLGDMGAALAELDSAVEVDDLDIALDADCFIGHDGFLRWLSVWDESWESSTMEDIEITPVGADRVIALFVARVKGKGSGIELTRSDAATCRLRDSKIVEIAYYNDQQQAIEAIGLRGGR